ncbi:hypothetical protein ES703_30967 [subsurface metagenome]
MGIRVEPLPDPFANDCLRCYPPGKTPRILYAVFKGIELGINWNPALPPPPNDTFELIQHDLIHCTWTYDGDKWHVVYEAEIFPPAGPGSGLAIGTQEEVPKMGFASFLPLLCHASFDNRVHDPPLQYYTGGSGWIFTLTI